MGSVGSVRARGVLVLAAAAVAVGGCTGAEAPEPFIPVPSPPFGSPAFPTAPSADEPDGVESLSRPIEIRPVLRVAARGERTDCGDLRRPRSGETLPAPGDECLTVGEPVLVIEDVQVIEARRAQHDDSWVVQIVLARRDAGTWARVTGEHVGKRLAVVADRRVLTAPRISTRILGGVTQLAGGYSEREARDIVRTLAGS